PEARQLVVHGHFTVNGKKVDIPSYLLKEGDSLAIKAKSKESDKFVTVLENNQSRPVPKWLDVDREKAEGKVLNLPERDQIEVPVEEHLIVEFYSK
ncbi:MAG TPA: 30S ribosomal protein S4, partial [Oscillospiraceae bacterium]|nr:30S ribosomal protein S4 [Oscillospiraceae bacterium]